MIGQIGNDGTDNVDYATTIDRNGSVDGTGPFREGSSSGATFADFDQNYTAINTGSTGEAGAGSVYSVRQGDSLQSIALGIWGDASLWYMLAEANGPSASSSLSAGQSLIIPAKVAQFHNNADTFKAYDAGRAIGDVQPGSPLPVASAAQRGRCGIVGQILMVAVAVAVTYFTAGAATGLVGPVLGGAAAGGLGGLASQAFGTVTNIQPGKISFKGVAMAALSGAVGAGVGQIGTIGKVGSGLANASAKVGNFLGQWPPCRGCRARLGRQRRDAGPCDCGGPAKEVRLDRSGHRWRGIGSVWHHEPLDQRAGDGQSV